MARKTAAEAERTRQDLLDAALTVFADSGYATARLEDVAARAGVTRGALYHHFDGKPDLYLAAVGVAWDRVLPPLLAELDGPGPALERVERFVVAYLEAAERDERFRALLAVTVMGGETPPEVASRLDAKQDALAAWRDRLEAVLADARLRPGLTAGRAATIVLTFLVGATTTAQLAPSLLSPAREARHFAEALAAALSPSRRSDPPRRRARGG